MRGTLSTEASMTQAARLGREEFRPGFDWVARELIFPDERREAVFEAVHTGLYEGINRRLKLLRPVWVEGVEWPAGHAYLQESAREEWEEEGEWQEGDPLPEVPERELLVLLLIRFSHVAYRIQRNAQIREWYMDARFAKAHPFIEMNRHPKEEHALCGRGSQVMLEVPEGLRLMEALACPHPACRCTFDPSKRES